MKLQITDIEFDLTEDVGEYIDTELLQSKLQDVYIGQFWDVDDEEDLVEEITCASGWCINSIDYRHVLR